MNPIYKTFTTKGGFYIYDRSTNSIIKLDKDEFNLLEKKDEDTIRSLRSKGYLGDNTIERVRHHDTKHLEEYLNNNIEELIIQLTQNCNLQCSYCPYMGGYDNRNHSEKTVPIEIIKKGIDYLFSHSQNTKRIAIAFYGGEPLLEMPLLKEAIDYIEKIKEGRKLIITLTTNGTLLSDENVEYFIEKGINVLLSLDGAKEYHDANRVFPGGAGSFDIIMERLTNIKANFPLFLSQLSINSVISTDNDLACSKNFFDADQVMEHLAVTMNMISESNAKSSILYNDDFYSVHKYESLKLILVLNWKNFIQICIKIIPSKHRQNTTNL